jgi:hypothetical protein
MAEIVPPRRPASKANWLGSMAGTAETCGNIVGPVTDEKEWVAPGR